jgi:hypothetical protein
MRQLTLSPEITGWKQDLPRVRCINCGCLMRRGAERCESKRCAT